MGIPRDASLDGHLVDGAIGYLTITTGIAFAVLVIVLLVSLLLYRARASRPHAAYTLGDRPRDRLLTLAIGLTLFLAVDVTLALRYGIFFPGSAVIDDNARQFFGAGVTYAF